MTGYWWSLFPLNLFISLYIVSSYQHLNFLKSLHEKNLSFNLMLLFSCHLMPLLSFKPLKPVSTSISLTIQSGHIPPLYPLRLPFIPGHQILRVFFTLPISQHLSIFASFITTFHFFLETLCFCSHPHSQFFTICFSASFAGVFLTNFQILAFLRDFSLFVYTFHLSATDVGLIILHLYDF